MADSTPARLFCTVAGALLVIGGIVGFFYSAGFDTGIRQVRRDTDELFGILAVNGWDNLAHIALGFAALVCAGNPFAARTFSLAAGLALVLYALWGLALDDDGVLLGLVPVNDADSVVDLFAGLIGLGAGAATPPAAAGRRKPRAARPPRARRRRDAAARKDDEPSPAASRRKPAERPARERRPRKQPDDA